jgi:hypothetical protein
MSATDRFKAALTALVDELLPERRFLAPAEYRVDKCEDGKLTAKPASDARGLPPIVDMPIRGSIAGGVSTKLKRGTSVVVMFIDGLPSRPFLAWIDETQEPDELRLKAQTAIVLNEGTKGAARVDDTVEISVAQFAAAGATNGGGPVAIATPMQATIKSGSATVKVGG